MTCDAKIRPFPNTTEIICELGDVHGGMHESTLRDYAWPGSATTISWAEEDRRTFRGTWAACPRPGCELPARHRGNHAP